MKHLFPVVLSLLAVAGCSSDNADDARPAATAAFTMSRSVVEVDEVVQFTSADPNAARYEWRFLGLQVPVLTAAAPRFSHPWQSRAMVKLTTTSQQGDTASTTQPLLIGYRGIESVRITAMPATRPDGQPWRANGTNPNVFFHLYCTSTQSLVSSAAFRNVQPSSLPLVMDQPSTAPFDDGNWQMTFFDADNSPSSPVLFSMTMPVTGPPANRDADGKGSYTFQSGGWAFTAFTYTF